MRIVSPYAIISVNSRLSTFAFRASFFGAVAVGGDTAFTAETAFCCSPFRATVAQVPFDGCTGTAGVIMLLALGALRGGSAGRGGRTGVMVAEPIAMYCAMVARRSSASRIGRSSGGQCAFVAALTETLLLELHVEQLSPAALALTDENLWDLQCREGLRLVDKFPQKF